jgi:hypothetical protein
MLEPFLTPLALLAPIGPARWNLDTIDAEVGVGPPVVSRVTLICVTCRPTFQLSCKSLQKSDFHEQSRGQQDEEVRSSAGVPTAGPGGLAGANSRSRPHFGNLGDLS